MHLSKEKAAPTAVHVRGWREEVTAVSLELCHALAVEGLGTGCCREGPLVIMGNRMLTGIDNHHALAVDALRTGCSRECHALAVDVL